jgi:hypothetical protein
VRLLTFDVLVNNVFGLQMCDEEVQQYEALFKDLIGGFVPPAWDVPFTPYGKGVKARWASCGWVACCCFSWHFLLGFQQRHIICLHFGDVLRGAERILLWTLA